MESENSEPKVEEVEEVTLSERILQLNTKYDRIIKDLVKDLNSQLKEINSEFKSIKKDVGVLERKKKKKVKTDPSKRSKSGITNPVEISDELCSFFDLQQGEKYPRNYINKLLHQFIKENDLYTENNKSMIDLKDTPAGKKLRKLLGEIPKDEESNLRLFGLQKYLKTHYPKKAPTEEKVETPKSPKVKTKRVRKKAVEA